VLEKEVVVVVVEEELAGVSELGRPAVAASALVVVLELVAGVVATGVGVCEANRLKSASFRL